MARGAKCESLGAEEKEEEEDEEKKKEEDENYSGRPVTHSAYTLGFTSMLPIPSCINKIMRRHIGLHRI